DFLRHAVGEVLLLRIAAHVDERKDRDRGAFRQRQRNRWRTLFLLADRTDEAETSARERLDQALCFSAVAYCAPCGVDAAVERRVGDNPPVPYTGNEIVFAHYPRTVVDQIGEQVEYLGLDPQEVISAAELAPLGIESEIFKTVEQHPSSSGRYRKSSPGERKRGLTP